MLTAGFSRRAFVVGAAGLSLSLRGLGESVVAGPRWVLLGTDTGKGIYRAKWDGATGELGAVELAIACDRPNFFAMHPTLPVMYSVNEMEGAASAISAFRVDRANAELTLLNKVSAKADGPCFVSVDQSGKSAFAADYAGGTVAAYDLAADGKLIETSGVFDCRGNAACGALGPDKVRQNAAHLHCTVVSPDNDFMLACNLGEDAIEVFPIAAGKKDPLGKPMRVEARAGSGPRHVAFHPNGKWVYCVHELDASIDLYDWSVRGKKAEMTLREGSTIGELAKGVGLAGNSGCEIVVSDDGKFLYACERGVNELTVYGVDAATGLLTELQRLPCGGGVPRYIALDPSRKWLVCCNQAAPGSVTVFARDAKTGRLSETPKTFAADTAMFVVWV
ncbi:MAG: lactonase family protein [Acidobacteriota bacterium]